MTHTATCDHVVFDSMAALNERINDHLGYSGWLEITGATTQINYGANKVRFPSPVPVGSRIRLGVDLQGVVPVGGGMADIVYKFTTEVEGAIKPACVAEVIIRVIF